MFGNYDLKKKKSVPVILEPPSIADTLPIPGPLIAYSWYFISTLVLCVVMHVLAEMFAEKYIKISCSLTICYV